MVVQFIGAWEMVGVTLIKRWELVALERYYEGYLTASGQGISRDRTGWGGQNGKHECSSLDLIISFEVFEPLAGDRQW
jgi:hypothetical protein